jgi:hypothetical protein
VLACVRVVRLGRELAIVDVQFAAGWAGETHRNWRDRLYLSGDRLKAFGKCVYATHVALVFLEFEVTSACASWRAALRSRARLPHERVATVSARHGAT